MHPKIVWRHVVFAERKDAAETPGLFVWSVQLDCGHTMRLTTRTAPIDAMCRLCSRMYTHA